MVTVTYAFTGLMECVRIMEFSVLFGIDTETDIGSFTPFYNGVEKGIPLLLKLFDQKKILATFFWVAETAQIYPVLVKEVEKRGHEIGCHTIHHETIGDQLFDIPLVKPVLPEEVPFRLKKATEMIGAIIGHQPLSFRAPRLWGSTIMINTLEELGYLADASYPMYYFKKQLTPYHPSRENWTEPGSLHLLEIPNFADLTLESYDPYGRDRDQWPLFRTEGSTVFMKHIQNMIDFLTIKQLPMIFCFYFHPWEFIEMPKRLTYGEAAIEPVPFITKNCGQKALHELSVIIDALHESGARFTTAERLARNWMMEKG